MNITFVLGASGEDLNNDVILLKSWDTVKRNPSLLQLIDKATFDTYKALELNSDFVLTIRAARQHFGIPDKGFTWNKFKRFRSFGKTRKLTDSELEWAVKTNVEIHEASNKIYHQFNLPEDGWYAVLSLIYGDFIIAPPPKITYGFTPVSEDVEDEPYQEVNIWITAQITKNELLTFIENSWDNGLSEEVQHLPIRAAFTLTPRDRRIVELKDKHKMKYKDILKTITEEFGIDDPDEKLNDDSIKTAYHRAKTRILKFSKR